MHTLTILRIILCKGRICSHIYYHVYFLYNFLFFTHFYIKIESVYNVKNIAIGCKRIAELLYDLYL